MSKQSRVVFAATSETIASGLHRILAPLCQEQGLRLETAADRVFDDKEDLFTYLNSFEPLDLAEILVVMHLGADYRECFDSRITSRNSAWHRERLSTHGAGLEILLRFPQLFPVFVVAKDGDFDQWLDKWVADAQIRNSTMLNGWSSLHFVDPMRDPNGLSAVVARYSSGMRSYFDPTGIRTLVRNRFLGQVFGTANEWGNSQEARARLNSRLNSLVVTVDEEWDMALVGSYAAYKYGARAWVVTSYCSLIDPMLPHWRDKATENLVILRDLDLRFTDYPEGSDTEDGEVSMRCALMDIYSKEWGKLPKNCMVRALSYDNRVTESQDQFNDERRLRGQDERGGITRYYGLKKPLRSIYSLSSMFEFSGGHTMLSSLCRAQEMGDPGGHGAPYQNLTIAQDLIDQAAKYRMCDSVRGNIIAALLAQEAYSLLLGMSKTACLDAIREMNLAEAAAEGEFAGVTHTVGITERRSDLERTTINLDLKRGGPAFLSRMWAELRLVYKEGDQFEAAEEANAESLVNSDWIFRWRSMSRPVRFIKRIMLKPVHSLKWLLGMVFIWPLIMTIVICIVYNRIPAMNIQGMMWFVDIYHHVLISVFRPEALNVHGINSAGSESAAKDLIDLAMSITSLVYVGLIITVLFRRSTRG